jgi:hypothetical protein
LHRFLANAVSFRGNHLEAACGTVLSPITALGRKHAVSLSRAPLPRLAGSEGYEHFINLASFWETVGSLMQKELVSEDLAFDTFLDAPPWDKAARIFKDRRERDKQPLEGVNFEWIGARAAEWVARHEKQVQKERKPR